jgi:hypothetical protein
MAMSGFIRGHWLRIHWPVYARHFRMVDRLALVDTNRIALERARVDVPLRSLAPY